MRGPIRLQDLKSNISLEQSDEIVFFCVFYMLIPEIKCWNKNIRVGVVRNDCGYPGHKVNGWNNGWTMKSEILTCESANLKVTKNIKTAMFLKYI